MSCHPGMGQIDVVSGERFLDAHRQQRERFRAPRVGRIGLEEAIQRRTSGQSVVAIGHRVSANAESQILQGDCARPPSLTSVSPDLENGVWIIFAKGRFPTPVRE